MNATALDHVPVPVAMFRGSRQDRVAASYAWQQLFVLEMPAELRLNLEQAYRTGQANEMRLRARPKSGVDRQYRVVIKPLPGNELLATCIDVSEELAAREAAARATRLKESVLMAVSHELRAPLSALLLWEQVLRARIDEAEIRAQALAAIRESATAQSALIGELVDVFRVLSGSDGLHRDTIAVETVLASVTNSISDAARTRGVALHQVYERPIGDVHADLRRLSQALQKVLEAAVNVTPVGSLVVIAVAQREKNVVVAIGPATSTSSHHTARPGQSMALEAKLVVASELFALHGGYLDVITSRGGTSFRVSLPVHTRAQAHT